MPIYTAHSTADLPTIAQVIAPSLHEGDVLALFGGMGMGKTTFVAALCQVLGYTGEVTSPTFALVHEYEGGRIPVYHFDFYRVEDWNDLYSTGFFEYLDRGGLLITEWSENIEGALPDSHHTLIIHRGETDTSRVFEWIPKED